LQEFTAVSMIRWLPLAALKQPWMTPEASGMEAEAKFGIERAVMQAVARTPVINVVRMIAP
jgi:hypothetical protein